MRDAADSQTKQTKRKKTQNKEDWEHLFGVKIDTLDNPGWSL